MGRMHVGTILKHSPKIGRFPSGRRRIGPDDPIGLRNSSLESSMIELGRHRSSRSIRNTHATLRLRKVWRTIFLQYKHHIENPYGAQNYQKKNLYNLRTSKVLIMSHPPTQN